MRRIIIKDLEIDKLKEIKIGYSIECFLYEIIKLIIFIIVFILFGTLKLSLIALLENNILRYSSGGFHCNNFIKCLILSSLIFTTIGYLCTIINIENNYYIFISILLIIITIYKSPVPPPEKPINNKNKIMRLKCISTIILILILIIPYLFSVDNNIKSAIILSASFQVFSLTLFGKLLFQSWNKVLSSKGGE